ncbi:uncharacterized protein LOC107818478 [Nicotiana tabacum]|uniref:Uncharacterized protein LOC107818478 n=2 Tax=Nicotiana TaxID=4085 RepID=A0A1S4CFS6_TOBAC|nr:PREDICTED: uncharacterized protein LOC104219479 [Nicotiana sylvestris]XP_016499993.1 PREDICTED: uncharacterized protein LOC107818478 [Nicotiana tabacum]
MSVLQYPEGINPADVQIWNNAAFDNGDSEDLSSLKRSWSPLKPLLVRPSDSFESDFSSKENQTPLFENSSVNLSSPLPIKPLNPNGALENSRLKPNKLNSKQGFDEMAARKSGKENDFRDEKKIDVEIEEIEMEISRLNSRLEALRIEKAEKDVAKTVEKRGRVVAAKFMEPKQSVIKTEERRTSMSARTKAEQRRGLSLGPSEIFTGTRRRGLSMGPSDILAGTTKARQLGKQEMIITPVQPIQNRRKSCFWKLQEIEEEGKSSSLSPKSRKAAARTMVTTRQAVTTIASKKNSKKDDGFLSSVQPKKLFKDVEKSATANKKPQRPGRVVASRYNQSTTQSSVVRKRSLPENDKDESKRNDKKLSLSVGKTRVSQTESKNLGTESRVKKRWEIPSEIVVHGSTESEKSPLSITVKPDLLPRIRIARCVNETPRDSGPAKRMIELIGKKSFFSSDEDKEPSVCQVLSFAEEGAEEE